MKMLFASILTATALSLPVLAQDTYKIDPVHSEVSFRIRHLVSKVPGRFTRFQGTVLLDEANLSKSRVDVSIEAASISTDVDARDKHLKTADFFDVEKFPTLTFKSTSVKEVAKGKVEVTGDFTLHGVTKSIVLPVSLMGSMKGQGGEIRGGFEAVLKLNRNDYGIKTYPGMLGDEVDIALNIEAAKVETKK
jgi:polyisoprenoid-binding protein YceI